VVSYCISCCDVCFNLVVSEVCGTVNCNAKCLALHFDLESLDITNKNFRSYLQPFAICVPIFSLVRLHIYCGSKIFHPYYFLTIILLKTELIVIFDTLTPEEIHTTPEKFNCTRPIL